MWASRSPLTRPKRHPLPIGWGEGWGEGPHVNSSVASNPSGRVRSTETLGFGLGTLDFGPDRLAIPCNGRPSPRSAQLRSAAGPVNVPDDVSAADQHLFGTTGYCLLRSPDRPPGRTSVLSCCVQR